MNMKKILYSLVLFSLFNSCIIERDYEYSFLLSQIYQIKVSTTDSIYFVSDKSVSLELSTALFDKTGKVLDLDNTIEFDIYINDSLNNDGIIDLSREAEYEVYVKVPFRNGIKSQTLKIVVLDLRNALQSIEIDYLDDKQQFIKHQDSLSFINYIQGTITDIKGNTYPLDTTKFDFTVKVGQDTIESGKIIDFPEGRQLVSISVSEITSNELEIVVIDPSKEIQKIELDFSDSTRNGYAIAGSSIFDFDYKVYNTEGELVELPAQLNVNGKTYDFFSEIPITESGAINVYAEAYGIKSNVLTIESREITPFADKILPVIFHVVHDGDPLGSAENRSVEDLSYELDRLNFAFSNSLDLNMRKSVNAVDTYVQFRLAERDPNQFVLAERGVNRIEVKENQYESDSEELKELMFDMMWDPNQYVNVFVVNVGSGNNWAYYPVLREASLPGIPTDDSESPVLTYPYGIMMNTFSMGHIHNILPHEMGHYLGLYHTFEFNHSSYCVNADYCLDTEEHFVTDLASYSPDNLRENCEGLNYLATNIMDYLVLSNSFTYDQSLRINTTYEHALFFPRESGMVGGKLMPFKKGKLDLSVKPVYCPVPGH
jgi:hypothetical protein